MVLSAERRPLDVVATNVAGSGAVELALSLLPALEADPRVAIERIYLPDRGLLAGYARRSPGPAPLVTRRRLPNVMSRLIECTVGGGRFDRGVPLLVLGDIPLRTSGPQTIVVQTPHLLASLSPATGRDAAKYAVMRTVFRANASRAAAYVVQSAVMRDALLAEYRLPRDRVHIVQQPPPHWLLAVPPPPRPAFASRLRLFYPAAAYPHKNHALLARVDPNSWAERVERLVLTLPAATGRSLRLPSLVCVDRLDPAAMRATYAASDALLFLSTAESYGFPLVEAMWLGLPVIAADLPYARVLCGDEAIYFDPHDGRSLLAALDELRRRLTTGWRPDWSMQLAPLPRDWAAVAAALAAIAVADAQPASSALK